MSTNRNKDSGQAAAGRESYEKFVQLFARSEPGLRAFVRSLVPGSHHTDEVVQETCLVLWRMFTDYKQNSDFLNWALTVARFEVLKYRRKLARDRHVFSVELLELLADEAASETERLGQERQALDECIERLAPRHRDLIRACYAQGVSIKQVAERLERSATSLYKALNRIRILLLECIEASIATESHP